MMVSFHIEVDAPHLASEMWNRAFAWGTQP